MSNENRVRYFFFFVHKETYIINATYNIRLHCLNARRASLSQSDWGLDNGA